MSLIKCPLRASRKTQRSKPSTKSNLELFKRARNTDVRINITNNSKVVNTLHMSVLSLRAAKCKGHLPSLFLALTWLGRMSSSHLTRSLRPEAAASCNGRSPLAFRSHRLAPWAPIILTVSNCPLAQPQCAGVLPLRSWRFGSAPWARRSAVASAWPGKPRKEWLKFLLNLVCWI